VRCFVVQLFVLQNQRQCRPKSLYFRKSRSKYVSPAGALQLEGGLCSRHSAFQGSFFCDSRQPDGFEILQSRAKFKIALSFAADGVSENVSGGPPFRLAMKWRRKTDYFRYGRRPRRPRRWRKQE
jgi:hypothetical protein